MTTIHPETHIGAVHLNVRDLPRMTAYYTEVLGLNAHPNGSTVTLTADHDPLVVLHHTPDAPPAGRATGLFHTALLLPTRADLSRFLRHMVAVGAPLQGASDHGVSEALYMADPEGNGLEVYADRPREAWPMNGDQVEMVTLALDLNELVTHASGPWGGAPTGTTVGHIHLRVNDIPAAEAFYRDVMGFGLMARYGAQASFLAAGGYHHHIGANVWGTQGAAPPPGGALGLREYTITLPDDDALTATVERLRAAGHTPTEDPGAWLLRDPAGITVRLVR